MACSLRIYPGHNVWLLARTNRDAPNEQEVVESTAAFLIRALGMASPLATRSPLEVVASPGGERRYYIGAARPVEVTAVSRERLAMPSGEVVARREDCPEPYMSHVSGVDIWYVLVEFDWRSDAVDVPWPRRRVNWLGWASDDKPEEPFDWLLLEAVKQGDVKHDDSSLMGDVKVVATEYWDAAKKEFRSLAEGAKLPMMVLLFGVGVAVAFMARNKMR